MFLFFVCRTASPVSLMKFSPDGEFFATAGQVSQAFVSSLISYILQKSSIIVIYRLGCYCVQVIFALSFHIDSLTNQYCLYRGFIFKFST